MNFPKVDLALPKSVLKRYFGYSEFRAPQEKIIESVLAKQDTLAILPTGGGKSLCYQVPGLIFAGQTLVITPLISLMEDQVQALEKRGVKATYLSSQLPPKVLGERLANLSNYKFIYLTPERLSSPGWQELAKNLQIDLVAVDEAHCIAEWGHDFRPPYLAIGKYLSELTDLKESRPTANLRPVVIALTATATPQTRAEICQRLGLKSPRQFLSPPHRPNLALFVKKFSTDFEQEFYLLLLLKKHQGQAGIIYTPTREKTKLLTTLIKNYFPRLKIAYYHAGLTGEKRSEVQQQFLSGELEAIVATTAFGMGVDKPDIRWVIHFGLPTSIENYYQEIGRAGRDRLPSNCYLLQQPKDWLVAARLTSQTTKKRLKVKQIKLRQLAKLLEARNCLHEGLNLYFAVPTQKSVAPPKTPAPQTTRKTTTPSRAPAKNCQNCQFCRPTRIQLDASTTARAKNLNQWRQNQAKKYRCSPLAIITDQVLALTALTKPASKKDFLRLPGVGRGLVNRWAGDIIPII